MANIKDVAKRANVSITTVSHIINKTRYVSDELTERVNKAMEELDYQPNSLARGLRSGKTKIIGLVIPDISNQFFAEISRKIEDRGFEIGYSVILCNTDDDPNKEKIYIDVLTGKKVEGIIFISTIVESNNLEKTIESNIPIVVVDRDIKDIDSDLILVDNSIGGYKATKYLLELGHKRIACIAGPSRITPSAQRVGGYKKALEEAKIPFDADLVVDGDFRYESGNKAMRKLLALPEPPTAVFACNDMMALGAFQAINDSGLKIPDDISVVGFDNVPFSQAVYPTLTTMAQPIYEMADAIVDMLIERIRIQRQRMRPDEQVPEYKHIVFETKLIERDSCKRIREE